MYRNLYGECKNYKRQKTILSERKVLSRAVKESNTPSNTDSTDDEKPVSVVDKELSPEEILTLLPHLSKDAPVKYGPARKKERAHHEDTKGWEFKLTGIALTNLLKLRNAAKEREEKRLEAERLEKLRNECLLVEDIDLCMEENTQIHHTDKFFCTEDEETPQLVVRRGQEFDIKLTFQRPWNGKTDDIYIVFRMGDSPKVSNESMAIIKIEEEQSSVYYYMEGNDKRFGGRIKSQSENSIIMSLYFPPDAIIGQWEYSIRTIHPNADEMYEREGETDLLLLFNPWCPDDAVYVENETDRFEYVENDEGCAFRGDGWSISNTSWSYGQYNEDILEICLHLVRKAFNHEITHKMADPVYVSRALSRIINHNDDYGVLVGNWSGDYAGGTAPTKWKASWTILQQYKERGYRPVNFGQCWVFSHLLTAVARAIGLPCRSVTNFQSAHDTEESMTIDKYFDEDGEELTRISPDSVWNFHVWNEVWMTRRDLDKSGKYDGWQVIDATPQEASEGFFQCGPCPVTAVKAGDVNVGYETKFVYAEVNADVCHWDDYDPPNLLSRNRNKVGFRLVTKDPEKDDMMFITNLYKNPEGSAAERESNERALSFGNKKLLKYLTKNTSGIELKVVHVETEFGKDFTAKFEIKNTSEEARTIRGSFSVRPINYWGVCIGSDKIASEAFHYEELAAGATKVFDMAVSADKVIEYCKEHLSVKIGGMISVKDSLKSRIVETEQFDLSNGSINVTSPEKEIKADSTAVVDIEIENPLGKALTECEMEIDGPVSVVDGNFRYENYVWKSNIGTISPNETKKIQVTIKPNMKPTRVKDRVVQIEMSSKEIPDISGSYKFTIVQ